MGAPRRAATGKARVPGLTGTVARVLRGLEGDILELTA